MKSDKERSDIKTKKRAQNWLKRVRKSVISTQTELTDWEGEFLDSLEQRLDKYGRTFADPDLGAINGAFSLRQGLKIKQINQKTKPKALINSNQDPKSNNIKKSPKAPNKPMKNTGFKRKLPDWAKPKEDT